VSVSQTSRHKEPDDRHRSGMLHTLAVNRRRRRWRTGTLIDFVFRNRLNDRSSPTSPLSEFLLFNFSPTANVTVKYAKLW
jgi:hypothetical protein